MSLKGFSDTQQKMIAQILYPYMFIETNIKKKSLDLAKDTIEIINQAKESYKFALENNLQLPKSTYSIVRYGPAIISIFDEIEKYAKYEKVKKRVRKGVQYAQVIVWDKRMLEVVLRNSDKPKIKSQDDLKIFKQFLDEFSGFKGYYEEEIYNKYRKLFVSKNNILVEHFQKGDHYLKDSHEKQEKLDKLNIQFKEIDQQKEKLETKIKILKDKISQERNKFFQEQSTGKNISSKRDNLSSLIVNPPLSTFLKLLNDLLVTFDSYVVKQEKKLSFEAQGALQTLKEELTSASTAIDHGFPELVEQMIRFADRAFGKKRFYIKFLGEIGGTKNLKANLLAGTGYKAWYEARQISKDIKELEKTQDYVIFDQTISLLEKQLEDIKDEYELFLNRSQKFSQDRNDLLKLIEIVTSHLNEWYLHSKGFV